MPTKINIPASLRKLSWAPNYPTTNLSATWPAKTVGGTTIPARIFAVTKLRDDVSAESLISRGVTHVDRFVAGTLPNSQRYANAQWTGAKKGPDYSTAGVPNPSITSGELDILANEAYVASPAFFSSSEFRENGVGSYQAACQVYKRIYAKLQTDFGVTSPVQTNLLGDYGQDEYCPHLRPYTEAAGQHDKFRASMASQSAARQNWREGEQDFNGGTMAYLGTDGGYNSRNWSFKLYLDSLYFFGEKLDYSLLYVIERMYMAVPDRLLWGYTWSELEAVQNLMDRNHGGYRVAWTNPNGDIIQKWLLTMPFQVGVSIGFLSTLCANGLLIWNSNDKVSPLKARFTTQYTHKVEWQQTGGSIQDYNDGDPSQPDEYTGDGAKFPRTPMTGEDALYAGYWMACQIKDRADTLEYANFSYKINGGGTQNGYNGTNAPQLGTEYGAPYLSFYTRPNYGQNNIVTSNQYRKPIVIIGMGSAGKSISVWVPQLKPTDTCQVDAVHEGQAISVTVTGAGWNTFTI